MAKMDECKNRFDPSKCDEWIIKTLGTLREILTPEDKDISDYKYPHDYPGKANEICNNCGYFEK